MMVVPMSRPHSVCLTRLPHRRVLDPPDLDDLDVASVNREGARERGDQRLRLGRAKLNRERRREERVVLPGPFPRNCQGVGSTAPK